MVPAWAEGVFDYPKGPVKLALVLADLAKEFATFDRYERRARARRKFAVRAFDAARRA